VLKRTLWEAMENDGYDIVDEDGNISVANPGSGNGGAAGDGSSCLEAEPDDDLLLTFLIPVVPELLSTPDVMESVENIGISVDGIPLTGDPPSVTISGNMPGGNGAIPSIDPCGGHMDPSGYYHLHFVPEEINNVFDAFGITEVSCTNFVQSETALVGFAKDGFPVYASRDADGVLPADLDDCHGHTAPTTEFPDGVYHYHASSSLAPNVPPCLVGASVGNSFSFESSDVDADNDGVNFNNDCNDNDASVGSILLAGTACDDGDATTEDDIILSDGCTCAGTTIDDTCTSADADNDGICAEDDCDDNDANVGAAQTAGTTCDDGDATTENDVIMADGCTCMGTTTAVDPCAANGGDADNDGICAEDDCDDNDANVGVAQTAGTTCDDGDATTENDVIMADGCTCAGTTIAGTTECSAPTDPVATSSGTQVVITWTPIANIVTYTIQVRFKGQDIWLVTAPIRSSQVRIQGPQRDYEYRIQSNCTGSSSEYGPVEEFSITSNFSEEAQSRSKENNAADIVIKEVGILYPNPVRNTLNLNFSTVNPTTSFVIYNISGKEVYRQQMEINTDIHSFSLDALNAGFYLGVVQENGKRSYSEKFVKQ